jgi:hypothetical protein
MKVKEEIEPEEEKEEKDEGNDNKKDKEERKPRIEKDLSFLNKTPEATKQKEPLRLNPQTIKTEENTSIIDKGYMKYSFIVFCAILILLFTKKGKKKENEFR